MEIMELIQTEKIEHVKLIESIKHQPSSSCSVYEFPMSNQKMNLAIANIKQRFPETGYAINYVCSEMGYIFEGSGKLITENEEYILSKGDVIYIPPNQKYYWEGDLEIIVSSTPAWTPDQHGRIP